MLNGGCVCETRLPSHEEKKNRRKARVKESRSNRRSPWKEKCFYCIKTGRTRKAGLELSAFEGEPADQLKERRKRHLFPRKKH